MEPKCSTLLFTWAWHRSLSCCTWSRSKPLYYISLIYIIILSSHLLLSLPNGIFPSRFPTTVLCIFLIPLTCATYPAHNILLNFITLISDEDNKLWSSSPCNFIVSPLTPFVLGVNILLTTMPSNVYILVLIQMATLFLQNITVR